MIRFLRKEGIESCVICSESDDHLVQCKDEESWTRLYHAAAIRQHRQIFDLSTGERDSLNRRDPGAGGREGTCLPP